MGAEANSLKNVARAGERPVCHLQSARTVCTLRVATLGSERKVGGKLHLKLNKCARLTANKNCEGKMQRTLKRKLKVPGSAGRKVSWTSYAG